MNQFIQELKRRKVFKVAAVYAVVSWMLIQVATAITPALQLPTWTPSLVVVLLMLGFIPALIDSWAYEITPDGLRLSLPVGEDRSLHLGGKDATFDRPAATSLAFSNDGRLLVYSGWEPLSRGARSHLTSA